MRLFLALPVPGEIAAELSRVQEQLPQSVRYIETFHLTVKFLGEMDSPDEVEKRLGGLRFSPFRLTLAAVGVFPNWNAPTVVWVGLAESRELKELQSAIVMRLKGVGKPDQEFHAHLTMGRCAALSDHDIAQIRAITVRPKSFMVEKIVLYESTLTREGPVYREVASFG